MKIRIFVSAVIWLIMSVTFSVVSQNNYQRNYLSLSKGGRLSLKNKEKKELFKEYYYETTRDTVLMLEERYKDTIKSLKKELDAYKVYVVAGEQFSGLLLL